MSNRAKRNHRRVPFKRDEFGTQRSDYTNFEWSESLDEYDFFDPENDYDFEFMPSYGFVEIEGSWSIDFMKAIGTEKKPLTEKLFSYKKCHARPWKAKTCQFEVAGVNFSVQDFPVRVTIRTEIDHENKYYWSNLKHTVLLEKHVRDSVSDLLVLSYWIAYEKTSGRLYPSF